jgi:hypothetical protein
VTPHNLRKCLKSFFDTITVVKNYYIDECPPFDAAPNKEGFFVWDTEEHMFQECSEGLGYSGDVGGTNTNNYITIMFQLEVTCYSNRFAIRADIANLVFDLLYPIVSGVRTPLRGLAITNGFINHVKHVSTSEFDVQKTGQSTPEMSAAVLTFDCSFSVKEL